jgi:integrase
VLPRHIRAIRDKIAETPEAANQLLKFRRQLFAHSVVAGLCYSNAARDVPYLKSSSEGFHSWTIEEVEQFEACHPIGSKARLAMAVMLYTGQRRGDAVLFGPHHLTKGWPIFTQYLPNRKTGSGSRSRWKFLRDRNCRIFLRLAPPASRPSLLLSFANRSPPTALATGFASSGDAGRPHCTAHGLCKAAAARLAECGASENEIMAITGHRTSKEITRYTRGARQRVLAEKAFARPLNVTHSEAKNPSETQNESLDVEFIDENIEMVPRE